ncbi:hypothetical protein QP138_26275, partial [Escherichia coli]|nr:hypothetical protein [Escherichia coli]
IRQTKYIRDLNNIIFTPAFRQAMGRRGIEPRYIVVKENSSFLSNFPNCATLPTAVAAAVQPTTTQLFPRSPRNR